MHDCSKTKDRLIDLVFDEVNANEQAVLLAEMKGCGECEDFYRSIGSTLSAFDQATLAMSPGEEYWPGYESRLKARLREREEPAPGRALTAWLGSLFGSGLGASRIQIAATAALLSVALGSLLVFALFDSNGEGPPPATAVDNAQPATQPDERRDAIATVKPFSASPQAIRPRKPVERVIRTPLKKIAPAAAQEKIQALAVEHQRTGFTSALHTELVSHFERAQILLRSFRNVKPSTAEATFDLSYEKRMSRELIATNMLLRRNAETRAEATAKELLGQIEPLLLDIANLRDAPSRDDVRSIKEMIQKQEIVAALQLYSARASN